MICAIVAVFLLKRFQVIPDLLDVLKTQTSDENSGLRTPEEVDPDLARELYGARSHELITFFYRRTRDADASAQLLAETFATAALLRKKDPSLPASDLRWVNNIARLELSRYFRKLAVQLVHVNSLGLAVPLLTPLQKTVLDAEVRMLSDHARLGVKESQQPAVAA